jgi:hypothetical protein
MISKAIVFFALGSVAVAQSVSDGALQEIKVTSGRTYAMTQFNMPAVQVWLPRLTNSAYATEEFSKPRLLDAKGQPVEYEFQRGLYDEERWENEVRLQPQGEPARMIGTIHVHYPTRLRLARKEDPQEKLTEPAVFVKLPVVFVEQWKEVEISYDLPVLPKLPHLEIGSQPALPKSITDTPGGKVVVTLKP